MANPTAVFKAFKTKSLLQEIAKEKKVEIGETDSKSKIVKILAEDVHEIGLRRLLQILKLKELIGLALGIDWGEDKKPPRTKGILVKRIAEAVEKDPENYIQDRDSKILDSIVKTLEFESTPKKEIGKRILDEADNIGLENYFSSFSIERLQEFAEDCGLDVRSQSLEVLLDCIISQEDYKVKKKSKPKVVKPSKKKPDIKNGITKLDLNHYYYRDELFDYCKEHGLNTTGNKKEFIARVVAYVEGKPQPPVKGKKKSKKKKNSKKSKSEESKSEDKSSKSDSESESDSDEKKKEKTKEEKEKAKEKEKEKSKDKEKEKTKDKEKEKEKEKEKAKLKEKTAAKSEGTTDEEGKGKKRKADDSSSESESKKKAKK